MLREIFLWCVGRLEASTRENERKIAIGGRAAQAMLMYLHGLPITTIDATGETENVCQLRMPNNLDELTQFTRPLLLARSAERALLEVADELLHGRRFLDTRLPDRSLIGICDGNGNVLRSSAEIVAHMLRVTDNIMAMEVLPAEVQASFANLADYQAFQFGILAKSIVAHYYMAIVHLGTALVKQPVVTGERACQELIAGCILRGPVNSLPVYCACHTDPMKRSFEKAADKYVQSLR